VTEPLLLNVREVAALLRISEPHVRKLARRGLLPTVDYVGERLLFPRRAIEEQVEEQARRWKGL
jgi:excisionase family DNA binding protein